MCVCMCVCVYIYIERESYICIFIPSSISSHNIKQQKCQQEGILNNDISIQ